MKIKLTILISGESSDVKELDAIIHKAVFPSIADRGLDVEVDIDTELVKS